MQRIEFNGWELKPNIMICQQAYAKKKKNWFARELFTLGYIMSWVRPQMKTTVKSKTLSLGREFVLTAHSSSRK